MLVYRCDTVASEFVGAGITSQPSFTQETLDRLLPENPHVKLADRGARGYVRMEVTPGGLTTDLRALDNAAVRDSACKTLASYFVEDGRPGPQKA